MAVKDRNLFSPLGTFFLIIFGTEFIVSVFGNGFIIVVLGYSWFRSRKMLPCDFILTTLSLSRFLLQWVSTISQLLFFSSPEAYIDSKEEEVFTYSWGCLNMVSLWWATWLNVFYCVKVTNFTHPLFARLKLRIGMLIPRILGISLLAFIICIYIFPPNRMSLKDDLTQNLPENMNQSEVQEKYEFSSFQLAFNTISFSICVSASVLLLYSLWRHTRNLKKTGLSTKDISTQAHLRVMKPLLLLLFFYVLHFAAMIIIFASIIPYGKLERLITDMVLLLYPAAHSIILIFTNPKLNKAYINCYSHQKKCFLK